MKKILQALAIAGLCMFVGLSCTSLNPVGAQEERPEAGQYIGHQLTAVLDKLGKPTDTGTCLIGFPGHIDREPVVTAGVEWHVDNRDGNDSIHTLMKMCAFRGVIISQKLEMIELDGKEQVTVNLGRTNYRLLLELLGNVAPGEEEKFDLFLRPARKLDI